MGSDLGARHPEAAAVRARRSLAAARGVRDDIVNMVDSLKISKPPRAPPALPQSRRHALIPHAEGRAQLEARIRTLEDMVSSRDTAQTKLKAQWGRALVKRRAAERERDTLRVSLRATAALRRQFENFVQDIAVPLPSLRECVERAKAEAPVLADEVNAALDDIEETLSAAKDALAVPASAASGEENVRRVGRGTPSTAGSDDDARSVASYTSSALGDDREAQLDALVELVEILEVRLAGRTHPVMKRAKKAINAARARASPDVTELVEERDRLRKQLDAVLEEKESVGGEDAALALAAKAEAELRDSFEEIAELKERLVNAERLTEKVARQEELNERNATLESELRSAKKTIARLVKERSTLRKTAPSVPLVSNASSASKTPVQAKSDAMRRVLDWRQRASSENHELISEPVQLAAPFGDENANDLIDRDANGIVPINRAEQFPDRKPLADVETNPVKKRKTTANDTESVQAVDANSISERSLDIGANDSISAQSLPIRGHSRRHDSILSTGTVSASGDAITITHNRNIFSVGGPKVDGLRDLLNGP